jgi:hypothetical protein
VANLPGTHASRTGRILAGLAPPAAEAGRKRRRVLERYGDYVARKWARYVRKVGAPMERWARSELPAHKGRTLLYPFGGPDVITALRLFPGVDRVVLVSLQEAGRPPDPQGAGLRRLRRLLRLFRSGFQWFAARGFFLTRQLTREFDHGGVVEGITGVLLALAERGGYHVQALVPVTLRADGVGLLALPPLPGPRKHWRSVRLVLVHRQSGRRVQVDYVRMDLSDRHLKRSRASRQWLESMAANPVLLKAASHLLQKTFFSVLRGILLRRAPFILQDETGIEYAKLAERFHVTLYGRFLKVNHVFPEWHQKSLKRAYVRRKDVRPLPFRIGYQKPVGSCLQVARRRPAAPPSPAKPRQAPPRR